MTDQRQFAGKIAVVTGAGNGIGRAAAIAYAQEGADVAILDREAAALAKTAELVRAHKVKALPLVGDMMDQEVVAESFVRIKRDLGPSTCCSTTSARPRGKTIPSSGRPNPRRCSS